MMTQTKKIAFITPLYLPANLSGSGEVVNKIAEEFARRGYDISVITSNALTGRYWYDPIFGEKVNREYEVLNGVKVFRLSCDQIISSVMFILVRYLYFLFPEILLNKFKIIYNGPYLKGLYEILNQEEFDIVHCSPFPLNINKQVVDAIDKLKKKPKLIFTPFFHTELKEFKNPEIYNLLSRADAIHVVTNAEKNYLAKNFKIKNKMVIEIPLFLNLKKLRSPSELKKASKEFKLKYNLRNRKIIFFAGTRAYTKGAIYLLKTINNLYKKDSSYLLIAIGNNAPEWNAEKKEIIPDCLLDLGYVDNETKEIIFSVCDMFCMPSISESFGLTYLEAWHKKKIVIGANIPAVKEIISKAKGGFVVRFNDPKDLQQKIYKVFKARNKQSKIGINGHRYLLKNYDVFKIFDEYINLFSIN